ncbi:MAG: tyrosine-type recombinase/integrase [Roseiflexaceae bacterium]|nr:tyrosine-type recombinase/integrase [Roseiflexaceae bacterium]
MNDVVSHHDRSFVLAVQMVDASAENVFITYNQRIAPNTRRRQAADLKVFAVYLNNIGIPTSALQLAADPHHWTAVNSRIVEEFVHWQLQQGYAIGSIGVRLTTVKRYCALATSMGAVNPAAERLIATVRAYNEREGRFLDAERIVTRRGEKKATALTLTHAQAGRLKSRSGESPQGWRDALLMCLLLDHGLRVSEVAALQRNAIDLEHERLIFFRQRIAAPRMHQLTADTLLTAMMYLAQNGINTGPLLRASRRGGQLVAGGMSTRAINARVGLLGATVDAPNLSPHDCCHYWTIMGSAASTD